jgi:hypothetical protein
MIVIEVYNTQENWFAGAWDSFFNVRLLADKTANN